MSDNKTKRDNRDRAKVDSKDASEVEYLHSQFPQLTHQAITGAIRAAGPSRSEIVKYLKGRHK